MAIQVLSTKLHIPPCRPNLVPRPQLIERLDERLSTGRALTLISTPAGFGKTTLLSDWLRSGSESLPALRTAWLSLDAGDNDPARFMTYVVAALQTVEPWLGESDLVILQSSQPPPLEALLTSLLNEAAGLSDSLILVLDDYHVIESLSIHEALAFLLGHLPPQMHLVISTRADPPLPLARLRARGQMTELRDTDLRLTSGQASTLLTQVMGLPLSAGDVAAQVSQTEGWAAGLHMAGLSMQGRDDISGFVAAFTGSHRFIMDYLTQEVLNRQTRDRGATTVRRHRRGGADALGTPEPTRMAGQSAGRWCTAGRPLGSHCELRPALWAGARTWLPGRGLPKDAHVFRVDDQPQPVGLADLWLAVLAVRSSGSNDCPHAIPSDLAAL